MVRAMAIAVMAAGLAAGGCAAGHSHQSAAKDHPKGGESCAAMMMSKQRMNEVAIAVIHPTRGNHVHGIVRFVPVADGVRVTADLRGLPPDSVHGFHIHEFGDCSAPDATSAGGHYNPAHHPHAGPDASMHHAGDLGNITADAKGNAHLEMVVKDITVDGCKNPILGRAVVVHQKADDLKSQPTGDAGGRIGCGVIGLAKS